MESYNYCNECKGPLDENNKPVDVKLTKFQYPTTSVDAVVLRKHQNDEYHDILLIQRKHNPYQGSYALPGGFLDYNEEPSQACLRELNEECGLSGFNPQFLTVKSDPKRDPRKHVVSISYTVEVDPEAEPKGGDDASSAHFYPLIEVLQSKNLAFDHYEILTELIRKRDLANIYKL